MKTISHHNQNVEKNQTAARECLEIIISTIKYLVVKVLLFAARMRRATIIENRGYQNFMEKKHDRDFILVMISKMK